MVATKPQEEGECCHHPIHSITVGHPGGALVKDSLLVKKMGFNEALAACCLKVPAAVLPQFVHGPLP
jgi:hypothetical protein